MKTLTNNSPNGITINYNTDWRRIDPTCTPEAWVAVSSTHHGPSAGLSIPIGESAQCPDNFGERVVQLRIDGLEIS